MLNRSLFLFGAVICAVYMTVFVDCGGGHGDKAQWMEKMSKCGDEKINAQEAFKYKKECREEMKKMADAKKKPASEDEESMERRRRSPEEGGKHSKRKGRGKGRGHGKKLVGAVCNWKKSGVLNQDDGKFNEDGCRKYVDAVYPESKRDTAFEKMKGCNTDHGSTFSEENNFAGYGNFSKCCFEAHMAICELEMPNWGGHGGGKGKGKKPQQQDEDEDME